MKRQVYTTDRERKSDQLLGAIAFPVVNLILLLITLLLRARAVESLGSFGYDPVSIGILLLPWVVNGLVLTLAFLFRPQIGVGYLASIALIIVASVVLGAWLVGACIISLPGWFLGPVGPVLFFVIFLVGLVYIARGASNAFRIWWSPASWDATERRRQVLRAEVARRRLTDQEVQRLFDKFAAPLFQVVKSPAQARAAQQIARVLWQALVTEPDHEAFFFQTLSKAVGISGEDLTVIKDRYYWEMKPRITEKELQALKEHYRVRRNTEPNGVA